jgi:hypothetical protein
MPPSPQIPPDILRALVESGGAQITLILGAGCSMAKPPGLKSAAVLAKDAYNRLVSEGVLPEGSLNENDQWDLTKVAGVVKTETGSQLELTRRLPVTEFINAECNDGHRIAVALMLEGAIAYVVTLNYDKSMSHALAELGTKDRVRTVWGPQNKNQIQVPCLVYLHRKADSSQQQWVITAEALQNGWKDEWEDLAALQTLLLPICIFVGLGSSVPVLTSKIKEIRDPRDDVQTIQVDPRAHSEHRSRDASFTREAGISEDQFIKDGWSNFMRRLGSHVAKWQVRTTAEECNDLNPDEKAEVTNGLSERIQAIMDRRGEFGLLELGRIRASWLNSPNTKFAPHSEGDNISRFATPFLLIDLIERTKDCKAIIEENGVVNFCSADGRLASVQIVYGRGGERWGDIDAQAYHKQQRTQMLSVTSVLVYGFLGEPDEVDLPSDIANLSTSDPVEDSIMHPPKLRFEKGDALHSNPDQIDRLF